MPDGKKTQCSIIIALFIFCCSSTQQNQTKHEIYHYFSEYSVSHCSRWLNVTNQVGCSGHAGNNSGVVLFATDIMEMEIFLAQNHSFPTVLVADAALFLNQSLMSDIRKQSDQIAGMVILPLQNFGVQFSYPFSESPTCPNALYSHYGPELQCNVTPAWNPYGTGYSALDWPFPIVYLETEDSGIQTKLFECYKQFNVNPVDDTRCIMELNNHMSAVTSSTLCINRQIRMSLPIFESPVIYCEEINGVNIVLSATNASVPIRSTPVTTVSSKERSHNSSLIILARLDSRSMFERSGFASRGTLPAVSVLVSVAVHLMKQPIFRNLQLTKDVFFVFLDNEAYDFMGSGRLAYDLREQTLAAYTGFPLGWEHVYAIIELGELEFPDNSSLPIFYEMFDQSIYTKDKKPVNELMKGLAAANKRFNQINISRAPDSAAHLPLPPTASLQSLLSSAPRSIPHIFLSDHAGPPMKNKYFESFLDVTWSDSADSSRILLEFANTLSDAIHRVVAKDSAPMTTTILYPTPGDLMECFVNNVSCDILKTFLNPRDLEFLRKMKTPIPTQSYLPLDSLELKLSHIVSMVLMGLTGERASDENCLPEHSTFDPYNYLMGYYNGNTQCYRTLLNLATRFTMFKDGKPASPGWMRSRTVSGSRYVRWYRSTSVVMDAFSVAFGIILIFLTICVSLVIRRKTNIRIVFDAEMRTNILQSVI